MNEELQVQVKEKLKTLSKYGKFNIVSKTVDDAKRIHPDKKAERTIFLTDSNKKEQRQELKNRLKSWVGLLEESESVADMKGKAKEKADKAKDILNENVKAALDATRTLEQSYNSLYLFFKNAKQDKIKNLTLLNASMNQLADPQLDLFRTQIKDKLLWAYGTLGKSENYSILAIPGCLSNRSVLNEFSEMAKLNKVMFLTDFHDLSSYDTVLQEFEDSGYEGLEKYNTIMTCNWIVGRGKDGEADELDDLTIPPSSVLAGMLYNPNVQISQPRAGKRYGAMSYVEDVRFPLLQEHIGRLDAKGLVPLVKDFKSVMPYSAKTLSTADDVGLQTYSVVRVYDWVAKVVMDFLNQATFENASEQMLETYKSQIAKFLSSIKGHKKLIKDYEIKKFTPDTANGQPDRILVHIVMDPLFPAKSFALKMDGTKGDGIDKYDWNVSVSEN